MIRVAMVSGIRPETNYSAYLIDALQKYCSDQVEVYAYCENEPDNYSIALENKKYCWDRNWRYFFQVLSQARRDRLDVIHFQHEINMYGGPRTAVIFPFLVLFSRIFGFRPVVTLHAAVPIGSFNEEFLKVFEWPSPKLLAPLVAIIFPIIYFFIGLFVQKIIVHSLGLRNILVSDYKINANKIEVIPHGVPEDIGHQLPSIGSKLRNTIEGKKFILYFGYLHRRKGLEYLIKAFREVSERHKNLILILGGGTILPNYTRELEGRIKFLDLADKVFITGFLNLTDLRFLLDRCEFVVLPAIYSIAASGPLAQVFAHEKAVIVSDLGVYGEEIQSGVNGLLSKVRDEEDLAQKIELLLTDYELKARIVGNVKLIREERLWSKVARQTANVYLSLIKGQKL